LFMVGMILLAVVFYWFLCHFETHAPEVPHGSTMWELQGPQWNPCTEYMMLVFLGMGDHFLRGQGLSWSMNRVPLVWAFLCWRKNLVTAGMCIRCTIS
jgi:hypothetical protein